MERDAIFELLLRAGDESLPQGERDAAEATLVERGAENLPALIEAASEPDSLVAETALEALVKIGSRALIPLAEAVRDGERAARFDLIEAIEGIGRTMARGTVDIERVVEVLVGVLETSDPSDDTELFEAAAAADALGSLGAEAAVPALIAALGDENYVCVCAAGALGAIGDSRAVAALIEVLQDQDRFWVPRGAAAVALGDLRDKAAGALPALKRALDYDIHDDRDTWEERAREAVVDAIRRINDPTAESALKGQGMRYEMWGIY